MLVAQVAVDTHGERSAIFVPEPPGKSWNIHTRLNADGREKVPKVVMSDPLDSEDFARPTDRFPTFPDSMDLLQLIGQPEIGDSPGRRPE